MSQKAGSQVFSEIKPFQTKPAQISSFPKKAQQKNLVGPKFSKRLKEASQKYLKNFLIQFSVFRDLSTGKIVYSYPDFETGEVISFVEAGSGRGSKEIENVALQAYKEYGPGVYVTVASQTQQRNFNGYIVQFKEDPLITLWKKLHQQKTPKKDSFASIESSIESQFISYKVAFNHQFQSHISSLKKIIPDFERKLQREFKHVFNGVALNISSKEAQEIKKQPYVKNVFPNYQVKTFLMDSVPLIRADKVWNELGYDGSGVTIAIIDTGIDYTHPDLGGCTSVGPNCKVVGGYDFVNGDNDPMDDNGHGTHCAGIAAGNGELKGVAPGAKLYAYKVIDKDGTGDWATVIAGIERAMDPNQDGDYSDHVDVISMSLGGGEGMPDEPISLAADTAVDGGAVVVVAAGNSGPSFFTIESPGAGRKVITVGASYKTNYEGEYWGDENPSRDQITSFSSRGPTQMQPKPDIVAPGAFICSARYDNVHSDAVCHDQKHVQLAGTSMATPHVAGVAALIKQAHPDWTPLEIKMALRNTAKDLGYSIFEQGWGRVDAWEAINSPKPPVAQLYNRYKIYGDSFDIKGTATGDHYTLYYTQGRNGNFDTASWRKICDRFNEEVENGTLCSWDIRNLLDGEYTLKLVSRRGSQESVDYAFVKIENVKITYPNTLESEDPWYKWWENAEVFPSRKSIQIKGRVWGANFERYTIEWCNEDKSYCSTEGIALYNSQGLDPVREEGKLGKWYFPSLKKGEYLYLKLTAYYTDGSSQEDWVKIYVDPTLHRGWPQKIKTQSKGFFALTFLDQPTLADIDNNGAKDLIIAYERHVYVFKEDGSFLSGWPRVIKTYCGLQRQKQKGIIQIGPAVADLDKDGFNEIVVGDSCGYLHIFNHEGTYLKGWPKRVSHNYIDRVSIDDINRDGELEIIFSDWGGQVHVLNKEGRELEGFPKNLLSQGSYHFPAIERAVLVADVNNDNYKELLVVLDSMVYLLDFKGNVLAGWPKIFVDRIVKAALADVDGNGTIEIILAISPKTIYIYSFDGEIIEKIQESNKGAKKLVLGLTLGDVDKDGKLEILTTGNSAYETLHLFKKRKDGWKEVEGFPIEFDQNQIKTALGGQPLLGDLDADPENETPNGLYGGIWEAGKLPEIYAFNPNASIVEGFPKMLDGFSVGTGHPIGDIDNDGKNELIVYSWTGSVFVWDTEGEAQGNEWPVFYRNARHTGLYSRPVNQKFINLLFPNGREEWNLGNNYEIRWQAKGVDNIAILLKNSTRNSFYTIVNQYKAHKESYSWTIPKNFFDFHPDWSDQDNYVIVVAEVRNDGTFGVQDESDDYLKITAPLICTDSDGGIDYYTKGITVLKYFNNSFSAFTGRDFCAIGDENFNTQIVESCQGNNCYVNEYYCKNNNEIAPLQRYQCPQGCNNGACIVNQQPQIESFTSPPKVVYTGEKISFTFSGFDPNNDNLSWSVFWGDGAYYHQACPSSQPNTNVTFFHTWRHKGTYNVTVIVDDCRGRSQRISFSVKVREKSSSTSSCVDVNNRKNIYQRRICQDAIF